ncbi:hypothetical protein ACNF42_02130 [Cuniculiplasma sp. SKW3]|uniref:hypothetical protein n=1 Tax=Cuniculiplasma sp. SKW3 TaxID=3400170 RepID=UPI003FD5DECB
MAFWLIMGAFLFGYKPTSHLYDLDYTSTWFSIIALYSISTIGTTVAYSLYYSNASLNFAFKFTKLSLKHFLISILSGIIIASVILGGIILTLSTTLFTARSGRIISPVFPYYALIISALGGIIMFGISGSLTVVVNNYFSLKNINLLSLLTTILSYIFGFSQISAPLPKWLVYGNPFSEIIDLSYYSFSGSSPHLILSNPSSPILDVYYLSAGLIVWSLSLAGVFIFLIPKIRPAPMEEARQI